MESDRIGRVIARPLRGPALVATVLIVWLAGAAYCHGYERLLTGIDEWPGSLLWSAAALLPWLALWEWTKSTRGRAVARSIPLLIAVLVAVGLASLLLELGINA